MATYIAGVTDYLPQIQPFRPDFNFLGNMLQTKQSRYDANYNQVSNLYGTLLNSPMLREQNIAKRDEFFKSIEGNIQKISGLDLSLEQNVDLAKSVFKGFYEDKDIIKDMTWTKNYYNQKQRSEAMRNCIDPDKCGGKWWEGGDKYLDYKAQEFKNASKEEALGFGNVNYIAAQDFQGKAIKAAKDAGFNVKYDDVKGDWIVTTTNGTAMVKPLSEFYMSTYGNDPAMMDFFKAQAYTSRKDWVSSNLNNYGSEDEANMAYVQQYYNQVNETIQKGKAEAQQDSDVLKQKNKDIDEHIKQNGVLDSYQDWINSWSDTKAEAATADDNVKKYEEADNSLKLVKENAQNMKAYLSYFDGSAALDILKRNSLNAASQYASLTSESTFRENPVAAAEKQRAFEWKKLQYTEGTYDPKTGEYIPGTKVRGNLYEKEHEEKVKKEAEKRLQETIDKYAVSFGVGSATPTAEQTANANLQAQKQNLTLYNNTRVSIVNTNKDYLIELVNNYRQAVTTDGTNKRSAVVVLDDIFRKAGVGIKGVDLLSDSEAYSAAIDKINKLSPEALNSMYQKSLTYTNTESATGQVYSKLLPNKGTLDRLSAQQNSNTQVYKAVMDQINKPREIALTKLKAEVAPELTKLQKSTDGEDQFKAQLLQEVLSNQKNLSDRGIEQLAQTFAKEKQNLFEPTGEKVYATRARALALGATPDQLGGSLTKAGLNSEQVAYKFAKDYLQKIKEGYDGEVINNTVAWNSSDPNALGTNTNAMAAKINQGTITASSLENGTKMGLDFSDLATAYRQALTDREIDAVKFGDQFVYGEEKSVNPAAQVLLESLTQALASPDKDVREKAMANFSWSPISGGDSDKVLFYVKPDANFVQSLQGTEEKKTGYLNDRVTVANDESKVTPSEGVAVEIPVKYLQDKQIYKKLYKDPDDFVIAKTGMITYDIPGGGKAKVVKSGETYLVEKTFKYVNDDGVLIDIPAQTETKDAKTWRVSDFKEKFFNEATVWAGKNDFRRNQISKQKGNKNPAILNK